MLLMYETPHDPTCALAPLFPKTFVHGYSTSLNPKPYIIWGHTGSSVSCKVSMGHSLHPGLKLMPSCADKLSQQGHTLNSTVSQGVPVVGLVTPQGSHDQADLRQRNEASTTLAKWPLRKTISLQILDLSTGTVKTFRKGPFIFHRAGGNDVQLWLSGKWHCEHVY